MSYKTSNAEGHVDFINTYDLEPMAQQVIPKAAFGYIASGAEGWQCCGTRTIPRLSVSPTPHS